MGRGNTYISCARKCGRQVRRNRTATGICGVCTKQMAAAAGPDVQLAADRERQRTQSALTSLQGRYKEALQTIEAQDHRLEALGALKANVSTYEIQPHHGSGTSEGVVNLIASDWHMAERVGREIGGLNTFNLEIAHERAKRFFRGGLRLTKLLQQDIKIETMVLGLLGDFMTGQIHGAENAEVNETLPTFEIIEAQNAIISGIEFLLNDSKLKLVIPCHVGNHARTTLTNRFGTELGHSYEYLMYLHLATYFRSEKRVQFMIPEGPHSYLQIYDQTIRFQHGHMVKYGGGVGGIYIPLNKAIAQWNKAKPATLDVLGHFHQLRDGGNFLVNGSLIGYNSFAQSIKADFEEPKQTLFLIDKKRGRTCTWPILLERQK